MNIIKTFLISLPIIFLSFCGSTGQSDSCDLKFYDFSNNFLVSFIAQQHSVVDLLVKDGRTADNVFTGDSLIALWPNAIENPFAGYMWNDFTNLTHVNSAIGGNTACDLIKRVTRHVTSFKPKFIFTDGGGNDLLHKVPGDIASKNISNYLKYLRLENPDARIVYLMIPPTISIFANRTKGNINTETKQLLSEFGNSCAIDMNNYLAIGGIEGSPIKLSLTKDGIHFVDSVYLELKKRTELAYRGIDGKGVTCFLY